MSTEVPEDTILPPQDMVAIRLSSFRVVSREATVELALLLLEELKESFFNDLLVGRVCGEYVLFELLRFQSPVPEFRVKGWNTQRSKDLFDGLHPRFSGRLKCVRVRCPDASVRDGGHKGTHGLDRDVHERKSSTIRCRLWRSGGHCFSRLALQTFVGGPRMLPCVLNSAFPSARFQEHGLGRRVAHTRHRDHGYRDC